MVKGGRASGQGAQPRSSSQGPSREGGGSTNLESFSGPTEPGSTMCSGGELWKEEKVHGMMQDTPGSQQILPEVILQLTRKGGDP